MMTPPSTKDEPASCSYALDLLVDSGHSCLPPCGRHTRLACAMRRERGTET
jgi:hypothetical protein